MSEPTQVTSSRVGILPVSQRNNLTKIEEDGATTTPVLFENMCRLEKYKTTEYVPFRAAY